MRPTPDDAEIDRLIHLERRLDAEVRRRFAAPTGPGRVLDAGERRQALALMADLGRVIGELRCQGDLTRRSLARASANTSASLSYLTVGRLARAARRPAHT